MFDQTFVNTEHRSKRPLGVVASLVIQGAVIGASVLISIAYTQGLPAAQLKAMLVVPKPPVAQRAAQNAAKGTTSSVVRRFRITDQLVIANRVNRPEQVPVPAGVDIPGIAQPDANGGPELLGVISSTMDPAPYKNSNSTGKPALKAPQRIGGLVAQANLVHQVQPLYPHLAKAAGVQGTVEFTATISTTGTIENLQLVSGHPLLVNAARDAVLQWRYRPTLLNGMPVEVMTQITVRFSLSQ